jgi:hypothetical protein
MWGQPPSPALSEAEGAVRPGKARQLYLTTTTLLKSVLRKQLAHRSLFMIGLNRPANQSCNREDADLPSLLGSRRIRLGR